ncbi:hypothetical protein FVEN_g7824 [Fusarium venenatum]|uniref:Lysine-specific metallo-endopeptidase domain-containing protein n=1 Tax=Fusarium venenatum TaxID=56646 RepID=A0A2L2TAC2_9HYPO|nr:uncharacterized protein FVRRES_07971 [Fusarium venenatum]KAG8354469.1 hypothetical protein FVEN_g7824 [Fusarium venenatum]KAH6964763.1 hypothetical protein EDB82DRAFT_560487 [Fusarium venenatum]CEI67894.1 unnamed protein product [Fusarium venenatum]
MKLISALVIILKLVSLTEAARWTLHKSCYDNDAYKSGMIQAMETAKSRSAFAVSKMTSINPFDSFIKLARLLTTSGDAGVLRGRYEKFAELNGPLGRDSGFADSTEWTGRTNPDRTDFILYCAPDLVEKDTGYGQKHPLDNARQRILLDTSALVMIRDDIKAGTWKNPEKKIAAVTETTPATLLPQDEAAKIPNTITFNPIWLNSMIQNGGLFASDETMEKMTKKGALAELQKSWTDKKRATPIDALVNDLATTIHHELFHLNAFGSHKDLPADDIGAYGWMNNVENKLRDNPDLMAILALIFDLKQNKKITVKKDGEMKK